MSIELDPTTICNGVSPQASKSRARLRPLNADSVYLVDVEYDGESLAEPTLMLNFSKPVSFKVVTRTPVSFRIDIRIEPDAASIDSPGAETTLAQHRRVEHAGGVGGGRVVHGGGVCDAARCRCTCVSGVSARA